MTTIGPSTPTSRQQPSSSSTSQTIIPAHRIRIRTHPPLPPLQAWIPCDPTQPIRSLKSLIVSSLPHPSSSHPIRAQDILLELDGFAFLDQSLCSLIDPAHDLIDVKAVVSIPPAPQTGTSKKRPRSQDKISSDSNLTPPQPIQPTNQLPPQRWMSQPLDHATGPSSHQSSQLTIQQELPQSRIFKPLPTAPSNHQGPIPLDSTLTTRPPAPPGLGKASTQARNRRKRMKKKRDRELRELESGTITSNQSDPKLSSTTNDHSGNHTLYPQIDTKAATSILPTTVSSKPPHDQHQPSTANSSKAQDRSDPFDGRSTSESSSHGSSSFSSSSSSSSSSSASSFESSKSDSALSGSASSALSSSLPRPDPKVSSNSKSPAPFIQKTVPIVPNPQLTMLSLSNKNKRKNVKRHIDPVIQSNKIVFESPNSPDSTNSPLYMPSSPNLLSQPQETSTVTEPMHSNQLDDDSIYQKQVDDLTHEEEGFGVILVEEIDDGMYGDNPVTTTFTPSHGPPPSVRDPRLIPSNILITSVNVLNPYWTPGQIGKQQDWITTTESNEHTCSRTKKNRKNRKKSLKRRRRAAKARLLQNRSQSGQGASHDDNNDDDDDAEDEEDPLSDEDEIQKDVEEAYQEFISSGGHGHRQISKSTDEADVNESNHESLTNQISRQWDQLEKLDKHHVSLGSKVAIRTIELSLESFTPELTIYYGTVMGSNEKHLVIKLDTNCIPKTKTSVEEQAWEEEGGDEVEDEGRSMDIKESIRAQQRDALLNDLWGNSSDIRDWEWDAIDDARKI